MHHFGVWSVSLIQDMPWLFSKYHTRRYASYLVCQSLHLTQAVEIRLWVCECKWIPGLQCLSLTRMNVLLWEPGCPRKRAEQQAAKKRCLKKIIKYVIIPKYTKFFPMKEEEPQDQHKDSGCYMMFSIFELICVPGAKAVQLCRSCCGCSQAVWLAGTEGSHL